MIKKYHEKDNWRRTSRVFHSQTYFHTSLTQYILKFSCLKKLSMTLFKNGIFYFVKLFWSDVFPNYKSLVGRIWKFPRNSYFIENLYSAAIIVRKVGSLYLEYFCILIMVTLFPILQLFIWLLHVTLRNRKPGFC